MDLDRSATILKLNDELTRRGSWCGETHLQKSVFFLQELAGINLGLDYILYKHGPFSFEVQAELAALRAYGLLNLEVRPMPFSPSLRVSERALDLIASRKLTANRVKVIEFIAEKLADRGVAALEKLGTALYLTKREQYVDIAERAKRMTQLKPHVSYDAALNAVQEVDEMIKEVSSISQQP